MNGPAVALAGVSKTFSTGTAALAATDLTIADGSFTSVVGPSGCGKSTLLRLIAGLTPPTSGQIARAASATPLGTGFVFQDATLMPWATTAENIALPLHLAGIAETEIGTRVSEAVERVGLGGFAGAYPRELSGGMKMRVSIARAIVTGPRLLLMDEPFAALDEFTRFALNDDLLELWRKNRWTILFVTHSIREAVFLSERVLVMSPRPGRIVADMNVDLPRERDSDLRLGHAFADQCARVSGALGDAFLPQGGVMTRVLPMLFGVLVLTLSEAVRLNDIPPYILPGPLAVMAALWDSGPELLQALGVTLEVTIAALVLAGATGAGIALLLAQSKIAEQTLFPYAVFLQVTPIVTVAPFVIIWVDNVFVVLLILAWMAAVFPIISNTLLGLKSADPNLKDLFRLYGASRGQTVLRLLAPSALPYFLGGLRISGGLALIGTVVAEMVAGTSGARSGLASRLLEASYRLELARALACFALLSAAGFALYVVLDVLSRRLLRHWHESARTMEPS